MLVKLLMLCLCLIASGMSYSQTLKEKKEALAKRGVIQTIGGGFVLPGAANLIKSKHDQILRRLTLEEIEKLGLSKKILAKAGNKIALVTLVAGIGTTFNGLLDLGRIKTLKASHRFNSPRSASHSKEQTEAPHHGHRPYFRAQDQ